MLTIWEFWVPKYTVKSAVVDVCAAMLQNELVAMLKTNMNKVIKEIASVRMITINRRILQKKLPVKHLFFWFCQYTMHMSPKYIINSTQTTTINIIK